MVAVLVVRVVIHMADIMVVDTQEEVTLAVVSLEEGVHSVAAVRLEGGRHVIFI
jgi:hypothetical protein